MPRAFGFVAGGRTARRTQPHGARARLRARFRSCLKSAPYSNAIRSVVYIALRGLCAAAYGSLRPLGARPSSRRLISSHPKQRLPPGLGSLRRQRRHRLGSGATMGRAARARPSFWRLISPHSRQRLLPGVGLCLRQRRQRVGPGATAGGLGADAGGTACFGSGVGSGAAATATGGTTCFGSGVGFGSLTLYRQSRLHPSTVSGLTPKFFPSCGVLMGRVSRSKPRLPLLQNGSGKSLPTPPATACSVPSGRHRAGKGRGGFHHYTLGAWTGHRLELRGTQRTPGSMEVHR
jgi:hypothetical protein